MGLYDRDYFRENNSSDARRRRYGFSAVATIILLNVAFYLVDQLLGAGVLFNKMCLTGSDATNPLQWYHCLTYGFAHDPKGFMHIFCNMFTLFFFGPILERSYGKIEFVCFYLGAIIFGGIVWCVLHSGAQTAVLGASGGITAVVILFAFKYPKTVIFLWGILPMPTWLAGVLYVLYDAFGAHAGSDNIGHDVHLAGAAFAAFYYLSGIQFSRLFGKKGKHRQSTIGNQQDRNPVSSVFDSNDGRSKFSILKSSKMDPKQWSKEELEAEVDRILEKYSKYGRSSLTKEEEKILYFASNEFQKWQQ